MNWKTDFGNWLIDKGRSRLTISAYASDVDLYARWFEQVNQSAFEPRLLCAPDLREYRTYLLGPQQASPATWNRKRASLAVFAAWCKELGYVQGDPLRGVELKKAKALAPFWLGPEDFRRFRRQLEIEVNTARTDEMRRWAIRNRAMAALILYAGVRPGEVVQLDMGDIVLRERSGKVTVRSGKGDIHAELPLGEEARTALSAWLSMRGTQAGALFLGKSSERISTRQLERVIKHIGEVAHLERDGFHAHCLRHTFIRNLSENKQPAYRVQTLARHTSFRTTQRYLQDGWDDLAAAVE